MQDKGQNLANVLQCHFPIPAKVGHRLDEHQRSKNRPNAQPVARLAADVLPFVSARVLGRDLPEIDPGEFDVILVLYSNWSAPYSQYSN